MFGIGSTELLVILVVALIVLGPKSLASVSKTLGKAVGEFRRVSTDFQRTLNVEADLEERKSRESRAKDQPDVKSTYESAHMDLPPDSPVAQALAKAKAEAERSSGEKPNG